MWTLLTKTFFTYREAAFDKYGLHNFYCRPHTMSVIKSTNWRQGEQNRRRVRCTKMFAKHLKEKYDFGHQDYVGRYYHNRAYVDRARWRNGVNDSGSCSGFLERGNGNYWFLKMTYAIYKFRKTLFHGVFTSAVKKQFDHYGSMVGYRDHRLKFRLELQGTCPFPCCAVLYAYPCISPSSTFTFK